MSEGGTKKVTTSIDVWAFGCTVWEIFSLGERPYYGLDGTGIKDKLRRLERLKIPQFCPDFV